jgi:photosystem II stability/assembly factor-like uncharacterized protein
VAEGYDTSAVPSNESTSVSASTDGGATWQNQLGTFGAGVGAGGGLSCSTTENCVSVGLGYTYNPDAPPSRAQYTYWGAVEKTSNGGHTWTRVKVPPVSNLFGVSCALKTTDCVAVGWIENAPIGGLANTTGIILKTVNGGATWKVVLPAT